MSNIIKYLLDKTGEKIILEIVKATLIIYSSIVKIIVE